MAYLMLEKYLTDSLRADRQKEVERIAAANLMPSYLTREQYKADSVRAYEWFRITRDSSYIDKYTYDQITPFPIDQPARLPMPGEQTPAKSKQDISVRLTFALIDDRNFRRKNAVFDHS
jgi:penicillin-binding protein 2